MKQPEDWLDWEWRVTTGQGAFTWVQNNARVWRISGTSTGGGLVTFTWFKPNSTNILTLLPGQSFNVEPCGMYSGIGGVIFSAGVTSWMVEWLVKKV